MVCQEAFLAEQAGASLRDLQLGPVALDRQAGSGRVLFTWSCQDQPLGRYRVMRRALQVIRPAREKRRLRRALVVTSCWPRAIRAVQRARLCASACTASQAPFDKLRIGGEAARGKMVESHAVLQIADGILHLGVAAVVGLQFQGVAFSTGDEAVVAIGVEEGQLRAGRWLHPADDEAHRSGVGFTLEGV